MRRKFFKSAVTSAVMAAGVLAAPASALAGGNATCQGYNSQTSSLASSCHQSTHYGPGAIDYGQIVLYGHKASDTTTAIRSRTPRAPGTPGGPSTPATTVDTATGSLPFTGLDVGLLLAGAGVLMTAGLVARRLSSRID